MHLREAVAKISANLQNLIFDLTIALRRLLQEVLSWLKKKKTCSYNCQLLCWKRANVAVSSMVLPFRLTNNSRKVHSDNALAPNDNIAHFAIASFKKTKEQIAHFFSRNRCSYTHCLFSFYQSCFFLWQPRYRFLASFIIIPVTLCLCQSGRHKYKSVIHHVYRNIILQLHTHKHTDTHSL